MDEYKKYLFPNHYFIFACIWQGRIQVLNKDPKYGEFPSFAPFPLLIIRIATAVESEPICKIIDIFFPIPHLWDSFFPRRMKFKTQKDAFLRPISPFLFNFPAPFVPPFKFFPLNLYF